MGSEVFVGLNRPRRRYPHARVILPAVACSSASVEDAGACHVLNRACCCRAVRGRMEPVSRRGGEPKRKWSPPIPACPVLFLPAVYFSCSVREIFFLLKETVNVSPGPKPLPSRFFADRVRVFLLPILTTGFLTVFVRRVLFTR